MNPLPMIDRLDEARAISLWQPWASAISLGLKRFETRHWPTRYRGLIFIHAASRWTNKELDFWLRSRGLLRIVRKETMEIGGYTRDQIHLYTETPRPPLGAIVAVADLVECWPTSGEAPLGKELGMLNIHTEVERLFGDFTPGRYAWQLENVVAIPQPVQCAGRQGLWTPPAEVIDQVKDQMRGAA